MFFFFIFLQLLTYCLSISAVIVQIFNSTTGLTISTQIPNKETKAEMKTQAVM